MKGMICTTGNGWWGVVADVKEGETRQVPVAAMRQHRPKGETLWQIILQYQAIGRVVTKVGTRQEKFSNDEMYEICSKIAKAQEQAARLRALRMTPPKAIRQAAVAEVFPKGEISKPEWLAIVKRECCAGAVTPQLREWVDSDNEDALREYLEQRKASPIHTSKRALNLFLFAYWQKLCAPGMTTEKAWQLACDAIGKNSTGGLEAFQRYMHRKGVRFTRRGAPKKSDKYTPKRRSAS